MRSGGAYSAPPDLIAGGEGVSFPLPHHHPQISALRDRQLPPP